MLVRKWIYQPSSAQPLHELHGKNVLAIVSKYTLADSSCTVYFTEGDIISMIVPMKALLNGWKRKGKK